MKGCLTAVIMGVLFIAAAVVMSWWAKGMHAKAKASLEWPTAQGEILTSEVTRSEERVTGKKKTGVTGKRKTKKTMYEAEVSYRYTVEGKEYTGDKVGLVRTRSSSQSSVGKVVSKYPVGKTVNVHYDPNNPFDAALEPGGGLAAYAVGGGAVAFGFGGLLLLLTGPFAALRRRR